MLLVYCDVHPYYGMHIYILAVVMTQNPADRKETRLQLNTGHALTDIEGVEEALDSRIQPAPLVLSGFLLQIHQYLITKTAKDCSIMVALVPSADKEEDDEG